MRRGSEIACDRFVTRRAFFGADKFRARNAGRREHSAFRFKRAAGKQYDGERNCTPRAPEQLLALTVNPLS